MVAAVAAPVAIVLALGLWSTPKPTGTAPDAAPVSDTLRDSPPARSAVNAYSVTTPVPVDGSAADDASTTAAPDDAPSVSARYGRYGRYGRHGRGSVPASERSAAVSAPIEEAAPDFPSYGILDPVPPSGRSVDTAAAN